MKEMKRILALVLCFVMLVGMMPAVALNADAAGNTHYLMFATDRHANTSVIGNIINNMESVIGENTLEYLGLGGDMVGSGNTHPEYDSSEVLAEVTGATSSLNASNVDIVAGIHDMNVTDDAGIVLPYQGGGARIYEGDDYYVYGVEEYCISEDSNESNWSAQAEAFQNWALGDTIDTSKVIFVVSHYPLHAKRDDNDGAYYWHKALNTVATGAASGDSTVERNIVFFHGHNHTKDTNEYVYDVGDTMSIQNGSSTVSDTIYYTYATAGYLNQNSKATLVTLTDDTITLTKYSTSGSGTAMTSVERVITETTPTVNTVTAEDTTNIVTAVGLGLTGVTLTQSENADTSAFSDCVAYDVALEGYTEGETVTLTFNIGDMDSTDLVVYANGEQITPVSVEDNTEDDFHSVLVTVETTSATGTYIIGKLGAAENAVLTGISVTSMPKVTSYTLVVDENADGNIYLDITGLVITATYEDGTSFPVEWNRFEDETDGYALEFDISVPGTRTVKVTYGDFETSFDVTVYEHNAVDADVAEAVADVLQEGYIAKEFNPTGYTKGTEIRVVMPAPEGANVVYHVADDGTLTEVENVTFQDSYAIFDTDHFSAYVVGETTVTVDDPQTAPGSGDVTTTTPKTVYVLTSSISAGNDYLIVNSNSASSTTRYALANNSGSVAATGVTIKSGDVDGDGDTETYIELDDATDELWTVSNSYRFQNGGYYLRYNNSLSLSSSNYTTWSYSSNRLSYRSGKTTYYLRYNSGWTTTSSSSSASSIYFYVPTEIEVETTTTVSGTYSIAGEDVTVAAVEGVDVGLTATLTFTPDSGTPTTEDVSTGAIYEVVYDVNSIISEFVAGEGTAILTGNCGEALVKISYESDFGTVTNYITVTATEPYYTIDLHKAVLTEATGVTADNFASGTYYTFNETTNTYHVATAYVEGTTYYTGNVVKGDEITAPIALKGIEAGDVYGVWAVIKEYDGRITEEDEEKAEKDGHDLGDVEDDRIHWAVSNETIATIDPATGVLTFTGTNYGTFTVTASYLDEEGKILCSDTITISAEDSLYVVPGDGTDDFPEYPNEGAVRFDKTATAVGNFSETGIAKVELSMTGVPFTTGNELDVVLMLDMTGSMDDVTSSTSEPTGYVRVDATIAASKAFIKTIVANEDGTYNDNRVGVYVFNKNGAATLFDFGTVDSDTALEDIYADLESIYDDHYASGGTPYDDGLAKCHEVLAAAKTDGIGDDRQQFTVFMTDGVPTSYAYVNGTTYGTHSSASDIAGMLTSSDDYATRDSDYKYEYYSTEMKKAGVTVYSVGVGLENENNAWSGSATQCLNLASALLNDISGPGGETTQPDAVGTSTHSKQDEYFFSVEDATAATDMENVFKNIAQKILEAAKDVEVVDEIGNNYTVNFSIPGYGTDNAVSTDALDGTTEFYIQAVEYQLNADKERTGDPTVLENFTFNANGSFKSHTVGGVACEDCAHVTYTNDTITAIEGTYFSYSAQTATDENGETYTKEFLNWQAEKLSTTELALQYFAYLDNSTGVAEAEQIPAGTYYTNEEATLTYTNYKGNRVHQHFPVPQMTWNGAQVSYVFYLVNAAGQPVNRAGRVVPFAEAVYVTDVYTYSVVWNDLEQSAGLEAKYLAEKLVPEVYALYDDTASYQIHVYEDENEVNLNNHFVIGGNVNDEYNTVTNPWTNATTTYVFNNKSDATKYNTVGAYIANDGNDTSNSTSYYCKSAAIVGATFTSETDAGGNTVYNVTGLGNGYQAVSGEAQVLANSLPSTTGATVINGYAYYVDENGDVYTIVQKTDGTEVEKGFDFSNTTVAFAVVWKPELAPDTVVVDYGLDVIVDVITNDNMAAGVVGVRTDKPDVEMDSGSYDAAKAQSVDLYINANHDEGSLKEQKIGTAAVESLTSVRFSLDKDNGMLFSDPAEFYYEADVNYYDGDGDLKTTSMYSSVTVIPATTIYYEDEFVDLNTYTQKYKSVEYTAESSTSETYYTLENEVYTKVSEPEIGKTYYVKDGYDTVNKWDVDSITASATQAQDRPDKSKISADLDADNNYGYDAAYSAMSTYSMNRAAMVNVTTGKYATATFTFYGTGFDVISMTSNTTGTLTVKIVNANGESVKNMVVDTYYGYTRDTEGNWVATPAVDNALYQVPVIKAEGLTYGKYTVTITASYVSLFDHTSDKGSYDLYLDAIRIYDPANDGANNKVVEDAYVADGEGWPSYIELRNKLIDAGTFNQATTAIVGEVFIDGDATVGNAQIDDYTSYGPNNELYLAKGQSIAFQLGNLNKVAKIQLGIKSADGNAVTYTIKNITAQGTESNAKTATISTATDMYYDITGWKDGIIVITNSGNSGIISLTNIKATYTENPNSTVVTSEEGTDDVASETNEVYTYMTPAAATLTLRALNRSAVVEPEETEPETTEPETTEPETTEPETTEPETTEPETTEPETTEPEVTEPEETPTVGEVVKEIVKGIVNVLGKLFSRWF